jgi:hypothetical protein
MSYIMDRPIMSYINEERARCRALVMRLTRGADKEFLLYALDNAVTVEELGDHRKRFEELRSDNIEDLM